MTDLKTQRDAYDLILEAIDSGLYKPGDRLVGPTCRLCARKDCPARREPSILG